MTKTRDVGVSVRARLLRLARERGEDFQFVLIRYANERLLYRLSKSRHAGSFVLKGATLFSVWIGSPHRATRDLDLLGFGDASEPRMREVFVEILEQDVEDDGVRFDIDSLEVGPIRQELQYGGVRLLLDAHLTTAKLRLQVDIGFGDAITPDPQEVEVPALLEFPPPRLRAYPRETVVSEKLEAIVQLGITNSRMKDFHDLVILSRAFPFEGELLVDAIRATFQRRGTALPQALPIALTPEFTDDGSKRTQWSAFERKSGVPSVGDLSSVSTAISRFVQRPLQAARDGTKFRERWLPGGPWT